MKKYIGGYSILDLASKTIYTDALGVLKQNKPVLVYDDPEAYFADTIKATTIDDDVVVQITKGGKTITINDVNAVSSEGDIQSKIIYMYFINLTNVTLEDDVTLPNGNFLALITDKNLDETEVIPNGRYRVYNSTYGYNGNTYNIFEVQISDGTIEVYYDSGDINNTICENFDMKIYNKSKFII